MPSSRGSSRLKDRTQVSHIAGRFSIVCATRETQESSRHGHLCSSNSSASPATVLQYPPIAYLHRIEVYEDVRQKHSLSGIPN